ncbi:MAG: hypB [Massilibacillus sp.]|jgi:hydrogenase nickel incorporation protein HypB|nr:hypB [Massilibacillus sp.]
MEIQVMEDILGRNDQLASENQMLFAKRGVFVLNLMGSPGSGKTSLLEKTMAALKDNLRMAVIEGDLFTSKDADRIAKYDVPVIQINTSGGCHLDAAMVQKVLQELDLENLDLLVVENVGNLVCPAEFNVGEDVKAVVLSITEGDDKPLKYPLIFKESAIAVLNKVDLLPYTNFDMAAAKKDITSIHPAISVLEVSCTSSTGVEAWYDWLKEKVAAKKMAVNAHG